MPTPGDGCTICFYAFTGPSSAGAPYAGKLFCARNAPIPVTPLSANTFFLWPEVQPDYWCGEGVNDLNGSPFNAAIMPPGSAASSNGTFAFSGATATVTDANCKATSDVKTWNISFGTPSGTPPSLTTVNSAGSFVANTVGGSSITGVYGYTIY